METQWKNKDYTKKDQSINKTKISDKNCSNMCIYFTFLTNSKYTSKPCGLLTEFGLFSLSSHHFQLTAESKVHCSLTSTLVND